MNAVPHPDYNSTYVSGAFVRYDKYGNPVETDSPESPYSSYKSCHYLGSGDFCRVMLGPFIEWSVSVSGVNLIPEGSFELTGTHQFNPDENVPGPRLSFRVPYPPEEAAK